MSTEESKECEHVFVKKRELVKPERRSSDEVQRTADVTQIPYAEFTIKECEKCKKRVIVNYSISR